MPCLVGRGLLRLTRVLHRTGGQIKNDDFADDIRNVDLTKVHYLSGPFEVEGAAPGDLLLVEIMDVQPFEDRPWGFTGIFDRRNGVCAPPSGQYLKNSRADADRGNRAASLTRFIPRRMCFLSSPPSDVLTIPQR